ncbi:MATE family efflux transporter [Tissierella sp.]|uniref:MATE family efflux transporter n=1 Tax=Tissierella sp. TaxID=41274 RepID=UPI002857D423|nr:MATE family efflux transporter [Tissierella sp.]MDR7855256.1 MATE family efflux transporter [Tissierella sp.]
MYKGLKLASKIDKVFLRNMLKIALPVMIQNLITSSLNMVDTIMVGKLGEVEIAAVGIANQYFFFFTMILIGLCGGCSVYISQYWGKKDFTNIKRVLGLGLVSVLLVSIIFMAVGFINPEKIISIFNKDSTVIDLGGKYLFIVLFSYIFTAVTFIYSYSLRSIGNTLAPLIVNIAALLCNVFFNYILIFGKFGAPALGVEGAAIATLIARVVEAIALVFLVYKDNGVFAAKLRELKDLNLDFFKKSYRIILPVLLNDVLWAMASLIYSVVYGRMGTGATAAIQICNTVSNMFMVVTFGMASASAIMIGNSIGEGKEEQTIDYAKKFMGISSFVSIILGLSLALTSPLILDLFSVSSEVRSSTLIMLYIISIIFIVRFLGMIIIVGILRGAGDARSALIIEGSTMWFIGVPLTIMGAFLFKLPVHLVYALAILEEVAKLILGLMRLKSRKWINNIT